MEHNGKRCSCERKKKYFSTNSAINFLSKLKYNTYDDFELISFKKNNHVIDFVLMGTQVKERFGVIFLQFFMGSTAQTLRKSSSTFLEVDL